MSVLPPEVLNALEQLLRGLASADNATRTYAEEQLSQEWMATRPEVLLMGFVELMASTEDSVSTLRQHILESIY